MARADSRLQNTPAQVLWQQPAVSSPVQLAGLNFPNRVGLAAGLDKNGRCIDELGAMGEVGWVGRGSLGRDDGRIPLFPPGRAALRSSHDATQVRRQARFSAAPRPPWSH